MSESILERVPPPADRRLAYGPGPLQFADVRRPAVGAGPFPAVVFIHGGFWRSRWDLSHAGHACAALTAAGWLSWSLEYRRIGDPGGGWPGTFLDVAAGARALFDRAAELEVDPARVVVLGHSAGGHLAAWLASLPSVPAESEIAAAPLPIRRAVSLNGAVDLRQIWELGLGDGIVAELLGGTPREVPERYAAASPAEIATPAVPVTLIHGEADDIVPIEVSERYRNAAAASGGCVDLVVLPGIGHFEVIDPVSTAWPSVVAALTAPD